MPLYKKANWENIKEDLKSIRNTVNTTKEMNQLFRCSEEINFYLFILSLFLFLGADLTFILRPIRLGADLTWGRFDLGPILMKHFQILANDHFLFLFILNLKQLNVFLLILY
jgi:hypothetical protein